MGQLGTFDLVAIALYAVFVLYIGLRHSNRQISSEEYFVAGRGMGSFVVGLSIAATLLSTISYLTTPGEMIKNGPGLMWSMLHFPISFMIIGYFVIPKIMAHKVTSGYELLHEHFGMGIRQTAAVLFILTRCFWMGFVIFTCGGAVAAISGIPLPMVLLLVGLVGTIYTVMGGVRAVMITDVVQFVILFGGAILAIGFITYRCGGLSWWPDWDSQQLAALQWSVVDGYSLNPFATRLTRASAILGGVMFWVTAATSDQVIIQRYLCTRDAREARRSLGNSMIGDFTITVVLFILGFALLGYFIQFPGDLADPEQTIAQQADQLFPHLIGEILPQPVTGLLLAALFAAAMSSLDSGISAIGSVLMTDFKNFFARGLATDDVRFMVRARWTSFCIGILSVALSYSNFLVQRIHPEANLLGITLRITPFFVVPLFSLFVLAFFVKFSTPRGAWAAILVGVWAGLFFAHWKTIVGYFIETPEFSPFMIMPATAVCSLLAGILVSWSQR